MTHLETPVRKYMQSPVVVAKLGDTLAQVRDLLAERRFSSIAVVDARARPVGVLSRTDLLHLGMREAGRRPKSALLEVPQRAVEREMTRTIVTVKPEDTVSHCAGLMRRHRHHRVFVVEDGALVGVFSTKDLMVAVGRERVGGSLGDYMSAPVFTVRAEEPIALATDRLARAQVSGLVVVDDGWPVGIFSQTEAIASAALPRDTPVEEALSAALLCLGERTPLHRAAAQAAASSARRVIATHDSRMTGIVTGLDFARAVC